MSHITKVKTHLKDGLILRKALKKLGYEIEERDLRKPVEAKVKEFMARKGREWIGFGRSRRSEGLYEMEADWEAMKTKGQEVINEIYQTYSQEKIMDLARAKGYSLMKNKVNEKGQIEIVLRRVG
jgi:hypothetical protein